MRNFKGWINLDEAFAGYVAAGIFTIITEAKAKKASKPNPDQPGLFDDPEDMAQATQGGVTIRRGKPEPIGQEQCVKTPLSGYAKHIETIQNYAHDGNPDHFAQVLMFSPLSAHASFPSHWNNFLVLMMILKHYFPKGIDEKDFEKFRYVLDTFEDKYHNLKATINGFKFRTVAEIWTHRAELMQELNQLANQGDDAALISRLVQITGVRPVKAGFMVQLLWGRAGCIDVHNVAIYRAVFPDLAGKIRDEKSWQKKKADIEEYVALLRELDKRGIGTRQLWDVWVNFVESMYKMITSHGLGVYGDYGPALDPASGEYDPLRGKSIEKSGIGKQKKNVQVPLVGGVGGSVGGMGGSATHLPMEPEDALKDFYRMYRMGQTGSEAGGSIIFPTDEKGRPLDPQQNLGVEPSLLHYFGSALGGKELAMDPEMIRHIIAARQEGGGKLRRGAEQAEKTRQWFAARGLPPPVKTRQARLFPQEKKKKKSS